jgi:tetratricopeptide (TPR) repeat protein
MTHRRPDTAIFLLMTRNPIRCPGLILLSLLFPLSPVRAEEPALRDLLRDALYTEEVTRDPDKAAKQYEELLARHDEQKQYAASALFRLAEVRRKQDRKDEAIKLYQRLIAEFPNAENEGKLARENLAALGGKLPEVGGVGLDEEEKEIRRLKKLLEESPDLVRGENVMKNAAGNGWGRVAKWLVEVGKADPEDPQLLIDASENGSLEMVRWLLSVRGETKGDEPRIRSWKRMRCAGRLCGGGR